MQDQQGTAPLDDFFPAWNQGAHPELYELENEAFDREGVVWNALAGLAPWAGRTLLDLGCGTGFWLPRYAELAKSVIGVEPDPELLAAARSRPGGAEVLHGSAEHIPLPDASVDVVHARFAYFFPSPQSDCTAGLAEVLRVLRPGGSLVVIDNDQCDGDFAALLEAANASAHQGEGKYIKDWWARQGASTTPVMSSWTFDKPQDLIDVISMEFPNGTADAWLNEDPQRVRLSYGYALHHLSKGEWNRR
ncbi:class I SAM-dependent methyltransferase [Arthrobacter sp. zg-Y1171]|uniref:class I SAM-dependent methyltransferase n=1 Tax=Arthrobacter sp. zg-Y1171 TaxID=2964610 RepID=UPI00210726D8|nr:class I SAM-dependent methyltransferase [Arthrobacter sp. zg-Y1171]MCQ1995805.1 class I SAM-dependent methyltransferase [Arthrobacter sp. zg-Y1171]UWX83114.1 class I SAM-dependent methyltransferase [Arthrobacter sp. zg-Y1171]